MSDIPSNLIPIRISELPQPLAIDNSGLLPYVYGGVTYAIHAFDLVSVLSVPTNRLVSAGQGLAGGGSLATDITLSLGNLGVQTANLANNAVTYGKIQQGSAPKILLGTSDAGPGNFQEITLGDGLNIVGTVMSSSGGGGVTNGNKGDITATIAGTVWTINNSAVTYAKMQNVGATDKILGRQSAGAGIIEEISCTAAGRALIAGANAAAQRVTLGLSIGTDVQAWSAKLDTLGALASVANLSAYAGLSITTDSLSIGSGAGTLTQVSFAANTFPAKASTGALVAKPITDFGLSLVNSAAATNARTTLGLVIGTNVQAFDATLSALAGLTIVADSLSIGSGTDAFNQVSFAANTFPAKSSTGNLVAKTITDYGLSLVAAANAAAAQTTLGLVIGTNVQAQNTDLSAIAALTPTNNDVLQRKAGAWTNRTPTQLATDLTAAGTGLGTSEIAFRNIPQNSQSAAYTLVAADAGGHILHPSADTTARIFTIPANASVAYPIGTALTFVNQNAAGVVTIAITSDVMRLAGAGTTGSRTLAANGIATAVKLTATEWIISGTGLS